ncbi:organic cation transporter protein-like isoform X1 [Helicoverpa zea]|uniref:organic cation transporter protein-like isoform X1 n=1 Tax=Helicoverpa zea TaxID=7113 RepID=UPI001F55AFBF|nr:organic cation transporter protein-like isoform X1 [Helicoverpa zea]XP_047025117.1 organic cation transporter protein-like isoform X1 [Helicoverpa zea]
MKSRKNSSDTAPELQELLQKPHSLTLIADGRRTTIIPTQGTNKEKNQVSSPVEDDGPDVVSTIIGKYGRWQLLMTFLLSLFSLPCTFHIYLPTFTMKDTTFWCRRPANLSSLPLSAWINYSQPHGGCTVRTLTSDVTVESILNHTAPLLDSFQKCTEFGYDRSEVGSTIISEWNLVCDRAHLTSLAEVMFLVGVGIGGVVGGWISDRFGRKRILMSMMVAQSSLAILALLVRSFVQYVVVRLIMGFVSVSVVYAAFVLSVELVGGKWVTIAGVCNFFWLPLAYLIVTLLSLVLPNWRDLQLSLSIPGCLLLALWFVLPESPRWLLSMGKTQEAKVILEKAAKINKREFPADIDKLLLLHKPEETSELPRVAMLFTGVLRKRTICLFLSWFCMTIAYYGLLLNIGNFNLGNLHVTSMILAVVEIPAVAISIPILLKAGRRIPIFISMLTCGLACVASEIFSIALNDDWIQIACLMIGKFSIGATNMMMPIFTVELYPTVVRNLGVGASQIAAGLGLICIPYLWKLSILSKHLPMLTIAALAAIGGAIILLLSGTSSQQQEEPVTDKKKPTYDSSPRNGTFTITDDRGQ